MHLVALEMVVGWLLRTRLIVLSFSGEKISGVEVFIKNFSILDRVALCLQCFATRPSLLEHFRCVMAATAGDNPWKTFDVILDLIKTVLKCAFVVGFLARLIFRDRSGVICFFKSRHRQSPA